MRKTNNEKRRVDYYCDRCSKQFAESHAGEKDLADTSINRGVTLMLPSLDDGLLTFPTTDICGKCIAGLCRWLKSKGIKGK